MIYYITHSFFIIFVLLVIVLSGVARFVKTKVFKNRVKGKRGEVYVKKEEENSLDNTVKKFD